MDIQDVRRHRDDDTPAPDALAGFVADVLVALTVVRGRTQLLQRHIDAGQITDARDCVEPLGVIEEAARTIDDRLHRIAAADRR